MIYGTWHFSFTVSNLEHSVAWYTQLLGLEYVRGQVQANAYTSRLVNFPNAHVKIAQLRIPGMPITRSRHHLELVEYVEPSGHGIDLATNNPGVAHLAFEVDDIEQEWQRLSAQGVRFKSDTPNIITEGVNKGGATIYFFDPDSITLELVQAPESTKPVTDHIEMENSNDQSTRRYPSAFLGS